MKDTMISNLNSERNIHKTPEYTQAIADLKAHPHVQSMKNYPHHGGISCYAHCCAVSRYSYRIADRMGLDKRSVARGALLHDFYLYDWHKKENRKGLHGFTHARIALANAQKQFDLSPMEVDIIVKHMWPLGGCFPHYRESFLVCLVDKIIALLEVTHLFRLHSIQ